MRFSYHGSDRVVLRHSGCYCIVIQSKHVSDMRVPAVHPDLLFSVAISDISTGQNAKQTNKGKTGYGIAIMRHNANSDKRSGDTSGQTGMRGATIKKICF